MLAESASLGRPPFCGGEAPTPHPEGLRPPDPPIAVVAAGGYVRGCGCCRRVPAGLWLPLWKAVRKVLERLWCESSGVRSSLGDVRLAMSWLAAGRVAAVVGMVAGGLTAGVGVGTAAAAGCYDGAKSVGKVEGNFYVPTSGSWTTSSRCADINLKLKTIPEREVRVCFLPSSGGTACQSSYKLVGDDWEVVASAVKDGTKFKFQFRSSSLNVTGSAAF